AAWLDTREGRLGGDERGAGRGGRRTRGVGGGAARDRPRPSRLHSPRREAGGVGGPDPGDEPLALRSRRAARRRVQGGSARRLRGRGRGGGCAGPRSVRRLRGGLRGDHSRARAARLQLTRPVGADSPPVTDLPTSATRLIALLGNPVAHSISPIFQNAAFRHAGVDGVYLALRCEGAAVPGLLRGIALAGGGGNVTVPHKEVAAEAVDEPTEAVRRTGACNTFWSEGDRIRGDNTDVVGSARAIE